MIRGYLKHLRDNLYRIFKFYFYRLDHQMLISLRYRVISDLGVDALEDITRRLRKSQKEVGYCDYSKAVKENDSKQNG